MKFRIKDQRKFNRFIIMSLSLITLIIFFTFNIFGDSIVEGRSENQPSLIVKQGDSLWTIAEQINSKKDVRQIVYEIKELNELSDSNIQPGKRLYIPK